MQQQPRHGSSIPTPTHGSCGKGTHQFRPRPPGALMPPRSDYPALAEASAVSADVGATSTSSSSPVKPGCMIELARLAKIPPPASGLTCPRCDSTDTKFCYYNNYSLSQPRHFCKTCWRYWTHGGAIRDIPLASSIRRRLSKSSSKQTAASTAKAAACAASATTGRTPSCSSSGAAAVPTSGRVAAVAAAATTLQPPLVQSSSLPVLRRPGGYGLPGTAHRRMPCTTIISSATERNLMTKLAHQN